VYELGEMSRITCSTELPVQSIQWLDESSRVVREGTSVQELVLDLTIAASHNNSRYTCRVSHGGFMESQNITIRTGRKIILLVVIAFIVMIYYIAPPVVIITSSGDAQIAGEDYTLTCRVTGGGSAAIAYQWLRDGVQLPSETFRTLSFSPLNQRHHNGSYVCEGTRSFSTVASTSVRIIVLGKEYAQNA
jgi:hypothetical protein